MSLTIHVAVPGDLQSRTGGYGYDRRVIAELEGLGINAPVIQLGASFPDPSPVDRTAAGARLAALPDGACVLIDGLAYAVLPEVMEREAGRLRIVALCHHPLALETGLAPARAAMLADTERAALKAVPAVVVTSPATAAILAADFAVPPERITIALPGTDPQPAALRGGNPLRLLSVATLTRRKGHDLLIAALDRIRDRPFECRCVGSTRLDPDWAAFLEHEIDARGLSGRITLAGERDDVGAELDAADVFVLPSRYEGYGMAFAEALARGLPVVALKAGAVPDVVPETAGILVAPEDVEALAAALAGLIDDPARREALAVGARAAGLALPRWQDTARRIAAVFERI